MKKFLLVSSIFALITGGYFVFTTVDTNAADLSQFQAGRIIDDAIFTDNRSMSAADIQNFLVQKNAVCLKDFRSLSLVDDNGDGVVQDSTSEQYGPETMSAAELIKAAADIYRINPRVLLVTLQKEQGLITTTDCAAWKYNTALGYGCPDTAPCDQSAYGFTRQIDYGTYHLRGFYDDSLSSVPYGTGNQQIYWHPDLTRCGSTTVFIQNRATAALYNYTPYQPNQASLNAGYGLGDSCSSYGNRNFYNYFNDWFGSTLVPNHSWQPISQESYVDQTKTTPVDTNRIVVGNAHYFVIKAKNTGNQTWKKGVAGQQVNLGTFRAMDRRSSFCDGTWLNSSDCNRLTTTLENEVKPGEIGTFEFWMKSSKTGTFSEYFNLVADGTAWFSDPGLYWTLKVEEPTYSWQPVQQQHFTDDTKTISANPSNLAQNHRYYLVIRAKNTGNQTWKKGVAGAQVNVGTYRHMDRRSSFCDSTWLNANACDRLATTLENEVRPGETGTFEFWIKTPNQTGVYAEYFSLVADGKTWLNDPGLYWSLKVTAPNYAWEPVSQESYVDQSKSVPVDTNQLNLGNAHYFVIKARNTGNVSWKKGVAGQQINLGTYRPMDRRSSFCDSTWLNANACDRLATTLENEVKPGEIGTFEFWMKSSKTGTFSEYFNLVADGTTWLNDPGLYWTLKVKTP